MDWDKFIEELKRAWDVLEELPVKGYQARVRITLAQEMILSCYNESVKAKKAGADEGTEEQTADAPEA